MQVARNLLACSATLVGLLALVGCAGQWDVPTRELTKLQGYRQGQDVALRDERGDELHFDGDKAIEVPEPGPGEPSTRLRFSVIRHADPTSLEGALVRGSCSRRVDAGRTDAAPAPCAQGADVEVDLHGLDAVRVVSIDPDAPPTSSGPPLKSNTGLVVGLSVGATLAIGTAIGIAYAVKGVNDLQHLGFPAAADFQGHLGRRR
jgi:hypothetical protein